MVRQGAIGDSTTLAETLRFLSAVTEAAALGAEDDLESLAAPVGRNIDTEVAAMLALGDDGSDLVYEDEDRANALLARGVLGCRTALPAIGAAARHARTDPDERVRSQADETAAAVEATVAMLLG
jgi:hypothetical protein